ncbi:DNA-3-methyladenine glycosylase isoform X1 [Benincasa hispida]|uniref:DNA-3-methyladenine glycosylase isoform X1 n=1 Tax=Benincasa hispida TaxID=102211 RepID=UPI0018FFF842|nr:DNA-3-methyladenine glycosylase isoform X1 [Benincasa hispida]
MLPVRTSFPFIPQSPFQIFASSFSYGMIRTHRFKKLSNPKTPSSSTELRCEPRTRKKKKTGHLPKSKPATDPLTQIAQFSPSSSSEGFTILPKEFFLADALDLAPRLLGKLLRRDDVVLRITEVEAYRPNDSACHGRFGVTARTAPVFGPGGHAYVYLCYGLHMMLNVVADEVGVGAAVLIRSCAPVSGLETIQKRRGQITDKPVLLTGPGKVGQALGLSTEWSNHSFYAPGGLELLDAPEPKNILVGPRVGIEYALPEHVNALWRFAIAGTPWISAPKNTLRPS